MPDSYNKIFGIGLPRTGTTSLARALEAYGIDTVHYPFALYEEGLDAPVVAQHTAFVDTPVPMFYQELDQRWPGSRFVLTTRDKADWLESMKWLRTEGRKIWPPNPVREQYKRDFYGTNEFDRKRLSDTFDRYHEEVAGHFEGRKDEVLRLNIIESSDTSKLVDFLGLEAEPTPWPRANASRQATLSQKLAHQFERRGYRRAGALIRRVDSGIRRRLTRDA
jgi:hypothetical protein